MTAIDGIRRRLMSWLLPATPPPLLVGVAVAAVVVIAETAVIAVLRAASPQNRPGSALYILGVVALTTVWGTPLGIGVAVASAVLFNYFYLPPPGLHLTVAEDLQRATVFGIVALASGGLAGLARARALEAQLGAAEADIGAEVARRVLGQNDLRAGLRAGSECLAARFGLSRASIEADDTSGRDEIAGATRLELGDEEGRPGWLAVPDDAPPATLERLRDRLCPALAEIVRAAVQRQELIDTLRASQQATQALLAEQAALRRVATMVATGGPPEQVFATVTAELHRLFPRFHTTLLRYNPDNTVTAVSERAEDGRLLPERPSLPIAGENTVSAVLRTRRTARIDYDTASGPIAEELRTRGLRRGLGVPIMVDGEPWGVTRVTSYRPEPVPADAERRLQAFTDLVATAIANTENRARLVASRARLVAAADDARRHIERDLHDGPQQRIVSLALRLRMTEDSALDDRSAVRNLLSDTVRTLTEIHESMTVLGRGIHPTLLTQGGICPMLRALARRSVVPVELRLRVPDRLAEQVEVAVFHLVTEALTNVAKHAQASVARVTVSATVRRVWVSVRDDGVGGADPDGGTGLVSLRDRIEALGGRFRVISPPGQGTTLTAEIPLAEPEPR